MSREHILTSLSPSTGPVSKPFGIAEPEGCFTAIKESLFSDLNDEAVILSLRNGKYYGLNAVGVAVWKAIQNSASFSQIESAVMHEFDVDAVTCRREVWAFLEKLVEEGLVERT